MNYSISDIEQQIGIECYSTKTPGIGGTIKCIAEDFLVREVLVDGSVASIERAEAKPPLGATAKKQQFLLCLLIKRNWDTFISIRNLARQLHIDQARIQFAGIKDARAVTAQFVTIERVSAEKAANVGAKDLELRTLGYFHSSMSPFYLLGNDFIINIISVMHGDAAVRNRISKIMSELIQKGGIPNFYGHQRFGTARPITHLVGKALVQGKLEQAALIFLAKSSSHEHPESIQARESLLATQDYREALRNFPPQLRFERLMLRHLVENVGDFAGAFRKLPIRLRLLFVQGYQSYLFNRFLSGRIKRNASWARAETGDFAVNIERSGLPISKAGKIVDETKLLEVNSLIEAGRMRVALPIVGFGQRLSQSDAGKVQRSILEEEGVNLQSFKIAELPEASARGALRPLVSPVREFSIAQTSPMEGSVRNQIVQLRFMLFKGSYATVLLREIMKPYDLLASGF